MKYIKNNFYIKLFFIYRFYQKNKKKKNINI